MTRSENMAAVRSKNTRPELLVRRTVHAMGYRFRLHRRDLSGTPDLVLPSRRKVIFVHGCFWHQHGCKKSLQRPKSNEAFWRSKLEGNRERDIHDMAALHADGWNCLVVWECELADLSFLRRRLAEFLE